MASSSECAMNNTAVSSSDFKIRAPDPAAGVVLCRDAQQLELVVGRKAMYGRLDLFLMNRPVAPVVRLAGPSPDEFDLDPLAVRAPFYGFRTPERRRAGSLRRE